MRAIVWLILLAVLAVVAATALGQNDGIVSIYWLGWRADVSFNLFLLTLVLAFLAIHTLIRGLGGLLTLPDKARRWRLSQRDRLAQAALRDALALYMAGRYTRAHKACQRAVAIQADTPELKLDAEFTALAHLLSAGSLHRLQDRARRDEHLQRAVELGRLAKGARAAEEGARLLAAECALEDRDAARALRDLAELPPGVGRRTQALRMKLQASRLARQPLEALRTARLLAKHQGFTAVAAEGLLRTLALETLDQARDADQLRQLWLELDAQDRKDPLVAARAAERMAQLGAAAEARQWLAPFWDKLGSLHAEGQDAMARALLQARAGLESDWLPRLDAAATLALRNPALALSVGLALMERQLWGKARTLLLSAANDNDLAGPLRRQAWAALGRLAEQNQQPDEAMRCFRQAALAEDTR
ncbi:heme biosynthesis protein HemY [Aquabacterium fontiphilum]|jgi:HemY protein|uniref:heme biosynthesis HemY N-terminal domain-containing protein n=1 Tax=Aquabacterium fontiphilum TaxID=450365 RepID=UPI0013782109|nr:heme biosynthesis HemY N-terminal domain-containing protein [Aquabacterium fontiphilum]NBD19626.1 heme biosynthesis protein HemY [Aquabacterium fontiphilum]